MDVERLSVALDVLCDLTARLSDFPEEQKLAQQAALVCSLASTYVAGYASALLDGKEPYEALLSSIRGEMKIPPEKASLVQLLMSKPKR